MKESKISRREFGLVAAAAGLGAMATGGCNRAMKTQTFSEADLRALDAALDAPIQTGELPGLVALVSHGENAHVHAAGVQDLSTRAPMRRDTIFRVASMTKPVTAAATMLLVEDGKFGLDDPIDRFLPELANRRVLRTMDRAWQVRLVQRVRHDLFLRSAPQLRRHLAVPASDVRR